MVRSMWTGAASVPRWYCVLVGAFFLVRAVTTLAGGADFGLPGDGWRSVFQLCGFVVLAFGVVRVSAAVAATTTIGVVYAIATVLEAFHGTDLLGVIPVDMRDRIVHPLLVVAAAICVFVARRRRRTVESSTPLGAGSGV